MLAESHAASAMIANARHTLRLKRLHAGHFLDNPASGQVLEKLGFRPTGEIVRRYSAGRRAEAPCKVYALDLEPLPADSEEEPSLVKAFCMAA